MLVRAQADSNWRLGLFVAIRALDSVLDFLNGESGGGLLVLTQRRQGLVINRTTVPPLGENVLLLVLPQLHGDLVPPPPELIIVLPFVLEVRQSVLGVSRRHFDLQ